MTGPMAPQIDMERVRVRFVAWIRWYMAMYPEKAPTQVAMASLLGITEGGLSHIFSPRQARVPSLETVLKASVVTGFAGPRLARCRPMHGVRPREATDDGGDRLRAHRGRGAASEG